MVGLIRCSLRLVCEAIVQTRKSGERANGVALGDAVADRQHQLLLILDNL